MKTISLIFKALFSFLAIVIGCSLIVWIIYNEFINRLPQYHRPHLAGPLGIAPVMIGIGIYWAKQVIDCIKSNSNQKRSLYDKILKL